MIEIENLIKTGKSCLGQLDKLLPEVTYLKNTDQWNLLIHNVDWTLSNEQFLINRLQKPPTFNLKASHLISA